MKQQSKPEQNDKGMELMPLPLLFCRSSLFVASRSEVIPAFNKKFLFASGDWRVSYTGWLLRQQERRCSCVVGVVPHGVDHPHPQPFQLPHQIAQRET